MSEEPGAPAARDEPDFVMRHSINYQLRITLQTSCGHPIGDMCWSG